MQTSRAAARVAPRTPGWRLRDRRTSRPDGSPTRDCIVGRPPALGGPPSPADGVRTPGQRRANACGRAFHSRSMRQPILDDSCGRACSPVRSAAAGPESPKAGRRADRRLDHARPEAGGLSALGAALVRRLGPPLLRVARPRRRRDLDLVGRPRLRRRAGRRAQPAPRVRLTDEQRRIAPPATAVWDRAHRRALAVQDGDIVLLDTTAGHANADHPHRRGRVEPALCEERDARHLHPRQRALPSCRSAGAGRRPRAAHRRRSGRSAIRRRATARSSSRTKKQTLLDFVREDGGAPEEERGEARERGAAAARPRRAPVGAGPPARARRRVRLRAGRRARAGRAPRRRAELRDDQRLHRGPSRAHQGRRHAGHPSPRHPQPDNEEADLGVARRARPVDAPAPQTTDPKPGAGLRAPGRKVRAHGSSATRAGVGSDVAPNGDQRRVEASIVAARAQPPPRRRRPDASSAGRCRSSRATGNTRSRPCAPPTTTIAGSSSIDPETGKTRVIDHAARRGVGARVGRLRSVREREQRLPAGQHALLVSVRSGRLDAPLRRRCRRRPARRRGS